MTVANNIGYKLSFENLTLEETNNMLQEYIELFGSFCEFKLNEETLKSNWIEKFILINEKFNKLNFSIHLPKDFLYSNRFKPTEVEDLFFQISKLKQKQEIYCITHFPNDETKIYEMYELYMNYHHLIPSNVIILFENPVVKKRDFGYIDSIDNFFAMIDKKYISNIGICLDIGHLLYSFTKEGLFSEYDIYNKILNSKNIVKYIKEIHLHDYDSLCDHKQLGSGKIDLYNLRSFIGKIENSCKIIIETSVIIPNDDGVKQFLLLKNIVRKVG